MTIWCSLRFQHRRLRLMLLDEGHQLSLWAHGHLHCLQVGLLQEKERCHVYLVLRECGNEPLQARSLEPRSHVGIPYRWPDFLWRHRRECLALNDRNGLGVRLFG